MADIRIIPSLGEINITGSAEFRGTSGTSLLYLSGSGLIGAGTTTPQSEFHVVSSGTRFFTLDRSGTRSWDLGVNSSGTFLVTDNTEAADRIAINLSGSVGIGTTNPGKILTIQPSNASDNGIRLITSAGQNLINLYQENGSEAFIRMYSANSEKIQLRANGNSYLNGGNVGIGTDSPATRLHAVTAAANGQYRLETTHPSGIPNLELKGDSSATIRYISGSSNVIHSRIDFRQNGLYLLGDGATNQLVVKDTGAIQITDYGSGNNTGTAAYRLSVDSSGNIIEESLGAGAVDGLGSGRYIARWEDTDTLTSSSLYEDANGNIGVGTTSPSVKLEVGGAIKLGQSSDIPVAGITHYTNGYFYIKGGASGAAMGNQSFGSSVYVPNDNTVQFVAGTAERMRIITDGNVGIGSTAPEGKLNVVGSADVLIVEGSGSTSNTTIMAVDGNNGRLFEVSDDLSDSLFSVNTIAGLPVMEAFADNVVTLGAYNQYDLHITGSRVGIGLSNPQAKLQVTGSFGLNGYDSNFPFFVTDSITSAGRYILNSPGMGFNLSDNYAQLQLYGTNGGYIDFTNAAEDSDARLIYYSGNRFELTYGKNIAITGTGVGIGTTSPSYLSHIYDNNDIWHTAIGGATGIVRIGGQTSSGAVIQAWNPTTNGTRDLYLQRDGGSVGIGLTTPTQKLHVNGNVRIDGAYNDILIHDGADDNSWFSQIKPDGTEVGRLGFDGYSSATSYQTTFNLLTSGSDASGLTSRILVDLAGNVGIGTVSPSYKLEVNGNIRANGGTVYYGLSGYSYISYSGTDGYYRANGKHYFEGASAFKGVWDANGNLGVGTTAPSAKLHVSGSSSVLAKYHTNYALSTGFADVFEILDSGMTGGGLSFNIGKSNSSKNLGKLVFNYVGNSSNSNYLGLGFYDNDNILNVTAGGYVGIGTTAPAAPFDLRSSNTELVRMYGDTGGVNGLFRIQMDSISDNFGSGSRTFLGDGGTDIILGTSNSSYTPNNSYISLNHGGDIYLGAGASPGRDLTISTAGNVGIGSVSPAAKLDVPADGKAIRLQPATSGGSTWMQFESKVNAGSDMGFILFQDESANSPGTGTEDVRFTIGVYNDFRQASTHSDELWFQGGGRLVSNVGSWDSELNTIIGTPGAGTTGGHEWRVNNSGVMYLTHGGSLGIGTSTPADKLHVVGDMTVDGILTAKEFHTTFVSASIIYQSGSTKFGNSTDDNHDFTGSLSLSSNSGATGLTVARGSSLYAKINNDSTRQIFTYSTDLDFRNVNGTSRLYLSGSGNIGIGDSAPTAQLHINSGGSYTNVDANNRVFIERNAHAYVLFSSPDEYDQGFHFHNTTDNSFVGRIAYQHSSTGDYLRFRVGSSSGDGQIHMSSGGSLGIGTGAPAVKLHVVSSVEETLRLEGSNNTTAIHFWSGSNRTGILGHSNGTSIASAADPGDMVLRSESGKKVHIATNGASARMTVNSAGNVGIGNTEPLQKLSVSGVINSDTSNDYYGAWLSGNSTAGNDSYLGLGPWYSQAGYVKWIDNSRLSIYTYSTSKHVTLQEAGGRVGIGITSPGAILDINHPDGTTNIIRASSGSGNYRFRVDQYFDLYMTNAAGTDRLAIKNDGTIYAPNLGTGADNSVVILDSDGYLKTDEIDSRVWGSSLVDGSGNDNYITKWSDGNTVTNSQITDDGTTVTYSNGAGTLFKFGYYGGLGQKYSSWDTWLGTNTGVAQNNSSAVTLLTDYTASGAGVLNVGFQGLAHYQWSAADLSAYSGATSVLTLPTPTFMVNSSGYFGIGTSNPGDELVVNSPGNSTGFALQKSASDRFRIEVGSSSENVAISANLGYMSFGTNGDTAMYISGSSIGIGTTNPPAALTVRGTGVGDTTTTFGVILNRGTKIAWTNTGHGTTGEYIYSQNASPYAIRVHSGGYNAISFPNTGDVHVNFEAGNLGVGTTTPNRKLHILNTDDTRGLLIQQSLNTSYAEAHFSASREYRIGTGGSNSSAEAIGNWYVYDATAAAQRLVINSTGNIGIGRTNPTALLHVSKSMNAAWLVSFENQSDSGHGLSIVAGGTTGTRYITQWRDAALNERFHMQDTGEVYMPDIGTGTDNSVVVLNSSGYLKTDEIDGRVWGSTLVDGSGAANRLAYWSDADSLTSDSYLTWTSSNLGVGTATAGAKLEVISSNSYLASFQNDTADTLAHLRVWNNATGTTGVNTGAAAIELIGKAGTSTHGRHAWIGAEGDASTTYGTKIHFKVRGNSNTGYQWSGGSEAPTIMTVDGDGKVGINATSPDAPLHVAGTGGDGTEVIRIVGSASDTFNWLSSGIHANLAVDETSIHLFGKAESAYNSAWIGYRHVSDGSTSNMLSLGLYSQNHVMNITGGSFVGIGTTSPVSKFHTALSNGQGTPANYSGNVATFQTNNSTGYAAYISVIGGDTGRSGIIFGDKDAMNRGMVTYAHTQDRLEFGAAGAFSSMVVDSTANVGIGTASPLSRLDVRSSSTEVVRVYGDTSGANGLFRIQMDSVSDNFASGSRTFLGDGGTDIILGTGNSSYTPTNSYISLNHGGSIYMGAGASPDRDLTITTAGNVGIGETSPSYKLHVAGTSYFTDQQIISYTNSVQSMYGGTGYSLIRLYGNSNAIEIQMDAHSSNSGAATVGTYSNHDFFIKTNNTSKMVVKAGGNVGINTTAPSAKLNVVGSADVLIVEGSGSTANTTIMAVDGSNGRLFEVSDDLSDSLFSVNTIAGLPVMEAFADNTVILGAYNQCDLVISGSKVGIGTCAPSYRLHVDNTSFATNSPALYVRNPNSSTAGIIAEFVGDSDSIQIKNIGVGDYTIYNTQQSNGIALYDGAGGVEIHYAGSTVLEADSAGGIKVTGQLSATADVIAYSSDERLKENIKPIENAVDKVKQMRGVTFDWNDKSEELGFEPTTKLNDVGVIAQEVEKVFPQLIAHAPFDADTDEEGNVISKSGEDYKTVNYSRLTAVLIEAIKEQQEQIEELREEIKKLKS